MGAFISEGADADGEHTNAALAPHLSTLFADSAQEESFHRQQTRFYNLI